MGFAGAKTSAIPPLRVVLEVGHEDGRLDPNLSASWFPGFVRVQTVHQTVHRVSLDVPCAARPLRSAARDERGGENNREGIGGWGWGEDLRTVLIDKIGCVPIGMQEPQDGSAAATGALLDKVLDLSVDAGEEILSRLPPKHLARLAAVSRRLRTRCCTRSLWVRCHHRVWAREAAAAAARASRSEDPDARARAPEQVRAACDAFLLDHCGAPGCERVSAFRLFSLRVNARARVRARWAALRAFLGRVPLNSRALDDPAITLLERKFNRLLPLELRELYLVIDGQSADLGWGLVHTPGLLHGHRRRPAGLSAPPARHGRMLPLLEALEEAGPLPRDGVGPPRNCGGPHPQGQPLASLVPLSAVSGLGAAGESYAVRWSTGEVLKRSGLSVRSVGTLDDLLASLVR